MNLKSLKNKQFIFTTSTETDEDKLKIKKLVTQMGSHLVNDWQNNCTMLITEKVSMTIKVVNALICQKLIVTQQYLDKFVKNALENKPPPNPIE